MSDDRFVFNGVDGTTGGYLLAPKGLREIVRIARGEAAERVSRFRPAIHGVDPRRLASTGWGVIFTQDFDPRVKAALAPLLEHRRAQVTEGSRCAYRELVCGPGETGRDFLRRQGLGPGVADPRRAPYYLLIVGSPAEIPFSFQYQLKLQHAVGRLWFETASEYEAYSRSVVEAETGGRVQRPRAVLFSVRNEDDLATGYMDRFLVRPLAQHLTTGERGWDLQVLSASSSSKERLRSLLGGDETPQLLFTSSHGLGFPEGHPRQLPEQGALLCGDWPGPRAWSGPIPKELYLAADDIGADVHLRGLVSFHFACHSAGAPGWSPLYRREAPAAARIAPHDFLAALPRRLLGHPAGGALAVIGHVDRAWGHSFLWEQVGSQTQTFESALEKILEGYPVGSAMEIFNQRFADISCELLDLMEPGLEAADEERLATLWMARNDARNYVILGDPAVRLAVAAAPDRTEPAEGSRRPPTRRRVRGGSGPAETAERRYADITAPRRLTQGRRGLIAVRLTCSPHTESRAAAKLLVTGPKTLELHLHCDPRDFEILESAVRRLAVEPGQDTDFAVFYVRGLRPGERRLTLDCRQSGEVLAAVEIEIQVTRNEVAEEQQQVTARPLATGAGKPPLAPDLDLRVVTAVEGGHTVLRYTLHSSNGAAPFFFQPAGGRTIKGSPEQYQAHLLERVEAAASLGELEAVGNLLYEELFSEELRAAYRRFRDRISTFQVISDEPWIPWELIKPFDYGEPGQPIDDDFLCARFQMTRWVAGWGGPAGEIRVPKAACVEAAAPPGQERLPYAVEERRYLSTGLLRTSGVYDLSPEMATRRAVEELLDRGGIGLWHFSAHGEVNPAVPDDSQILLADGWPLRPRDLAGHRQRHIAKDRPLVFLNACRVAQQGWSLTRLGGWAGAWVDRSRCGAFIGPLWCVDDRAACKFSCAFYEALRWGRTIGQAVKHAQQTLRAADPDDLTWLAYSVYAHPNAHVLLAPDGDS